MPSVSKISKSPITKYLSNKNFHAIRQDNNPNRKHHDLYFYSKDNDYLGEMMINQKGQGIEVHKLIFKEKLKPVFREYTRVKNKMAEFWSSKKPDFENYEYLPIGFTTTRVTIDLENKTQTKTIIERVLEQEPQLIQKVYEKYGIKAYELNGQTFKYKIDSITEETKPYKWNKLHKYNIYL